MKQPGSDEASQARNRSLPAALALLCAVTLLGAAAYAESTKFRKEFSGVDTPDHHAYKVVLAMAQVLDIDSFTETIYYSLNQTDLGGSARTTAEISREEAQELANQLKRDAEDMDQLGSAATRDICDVERTDAQLLIAYDALDDQKHGELQKLYARTKRALSTDARKRFVAWIDGLKQSHAGYVIDHKQTWQGRESMFRQRHDSICEDSGV